MTDDEGNTPLSPQPMLGWLIAPIAVLLALIADRIAGWGLGMDVESLTPFAVVIGASVLATVPRMLAESESFKFGKNALSLVTLLTAFILAGALSQFVDSVTALLFFLGVFVGHILDIRGRWEWKTVLDFALVGFLAALVAGAHAASTIPTSWTEGGQSADLISQHREAIGFVFFSTLMVSVILGFIAAVFQRGVLNPASEKGWFSHLGSREGKLPGKGELPLLIAFAVWAGAHIGTLIWFWQVEDIDRLALNGLAGYHGYIGFFPALFTGIVALIVAGMAAERWYTRAITISAFWILYQVAAWNEAGFWSWERLEGSWGVWIWFGITFFAGVGIYWFSTHEEYGGWFNRDDNDPSGARTFWQENWAGVLTFAAFVTALVVRIQWYVIPGMNGYGTGTWDMTGGSDPWYMKRAVDYVIAQHSHLVFDPDRFYPIGGINPRPPLFTWTLALGGFLLAPFLSSTPEEAVWWSMAAMPAIYGALTVFPIRAIASDQFGKGTGVMAAWLIAMMPGHITHSTWSLADHDAFVLLFLSLGFMFYLRAVRDGGSERLSRNISAYPSSLLRAYGEVWRQRPAAMANAMLAGASIGVVALGWKGFVYGPAILFLAYFLQVGLNMFRRRDSTIISSIFLTTIGVILLMTIPFYGHPQLDLIWSGSGLQPMLFIALFTLTLAVITSGFRDKPWLLVLGTIVVGGTLFLGLLWILQWLELSNAWNVLFTGGGYFAKTKVFSTVAEASAPQRAQLFANFGPMVFVIALSMGAYALWAGIRHRKQVHLVLGTWIIVAAYMAWSAGRFMFNASPAMAVMGAWGVVGLWKISGAGNMAKEWRRQGIRTPSDRISGARRALFRSPGFLAIFLVLVMMGSQQATYGLDAGIPSSSNHESDLDAVIHDLVPDILRWNQLGVSVMNGDEYDNTVGLWYLGSFGSSYNDGGWNMAYKWLSEQDTDEPLAERPAFVSWWDYGFQALEAGEHPVVADNFQTGIPAAGNMLLARSETDLVSMFIWQIAQGDRVHNGKTSFSSEFSDVLENHLGSDGADEYEQINTAITLDYLESHSFNVIQTNRDVVMAEGHHLENGILNNDTLYYRIFADGTRLMCDAGQDSCSEGDWTSEVQANKSFNNNQAIRTTKDTTYSRTHSIIGDYWYTSDMVSEFNSVETGIHKTNAKLALSNQFLLDNLDEEGIVNLYHDLTQLDIYTVQNVEGAPGEMITRNHEIRYFAIDNRLYPMGGRYTADYSYNRGQPTGIFAAPTILSGQDFGTFLSEVYETTRGEFPDEMTADEYYEAQKEDFMNQQAGLDIDPVLLNDVRIDHKADFFDTMLAKTYVGFGASTLGLQTSDSNPQPAQHFRTKGSPGSLLTNALPMPGAMQNHFVISNWYDSQDETKSLYDANTYVKVMKYYSGATISGKVSMTDDGSPVEGVRILLERDAFSGEDPSDLDADTYWIPIGAVNASEDGTWSYEVPAGRIRASAYLGDFDPISAQDEIKGGNYGNTYGDLLTETTDNRSTNPFTAILGGVANMTWLGEVQHNITGAQADREAAVTQDFGIALQSSGVSGTVTWSGEGDFDGDPLVDITFVLRNIWDTELNYTVTTTSGAFSTDETRILQGTGEVTFTEPGTFSTTKIARVTGFTGNHTTTLESGQTYTSNGTWIGKGEIVSSWIANSTMPDCVNETIPAGNSTCKLSEEGSLVTYLFDGTIEANGRMTAGGQVQHIKYFESATFEGIGDFHGVGTINGTGKFIGQGDFSGSLVKPGSFYRTGLRPGTYNMIAQMENGQEILLPDPVIVHLEPSYGVKMTVPGSIFADTLLWSDNTPVKNNTVELYDKALGVDSLVSIPTDENGKFSHAPLASGEYVYRVDVDDDGWYELNSTFVIFSDSINVSLDSAHIFEHVDLSITLNPVDANNNPVDVNNRTLVFSNTDASANMILETTSDEDGKAYIELPLGMWQIVDDSDDEIILWEEVEATEDMSLSVTYQRAVEFSGWIYGPPAGIFYQDWIVQLESGELADPEKVNASGLSVKLKAGSFARTTITDSNGTFSAKMPEGIDIDITALSKNSGYAADWNGQVSDGMDTIEMVLEPWGTIDGNIFVGSNSTILDAKMPHWEALVLIAEDQEGISWTTETTDMGLFAFNLPGGNWTITLEESAWNANAVEHMVVPSEAGIVEVITNPDPVEVNLTIFLDIGRDAAMENGSAISPLFSLVPIDNFGSMYNVSAEDYTSDGNLTLTLSVGAYSLDMGALPATHENASEYSLIAENSLPTIYVGIEPSSDVTEVILEPNYLYNGTLHDSAGEALDNLSFMLYSANGMDFHPLETDANGSFADYVPQGDWIVVVNPFNSSVGQDEVLRKTLSVNGAILEDALVTTEAGIFEFKLVEGLTGEIIENRVIKAVSKDGLGNISIGPSNGTGDIYESLPPGEWTLYHNLTQGQNRWIIEEDTPETTFQLQSGDRIGGNVTITKLVEVGGKVYWDLDADETPDSHEGIPQVTVKVVGSNHSEINVTQLTDEDGVWSMFLPIQDVYNVTANKSGFSTLSYDVDETNGYPVHDSRVSNDLRMTAGVVSVSGNVSYWNAAESAANLDGATVTLHPGVGIERDIIVVSTLNFDSETGILSWNAEIEPGEWVVVVEGAQSDENGGGITIGMLDAGVAEGGVLELVMHQSGYLVANTKWVAFDATEHHAGSDDSYHNLINGTTQIEIDLGEGLIWMVDIPADGSIKLLVPAGQVSLNGEFSTIQRSLDMEYRGGVGVEVPSSGLSKNVVLEYNRIADRDLVPTLVEDATGAVVLNDDYGTLQAIPNEQGGYESIIFSIDLTYDGTEITDQYDVSGKVGVTADSSDWKIEFLNSSEGETEEWLDIITISLGIGENESQAVLSNSVKVRVTPPLQNQSISYDYGHSLSISFKPQSGTANSVSISAFIPEVHSFELTGSNSVGIAVGGNTAVPIQLENTGNGDDKYTFEATDVPDGWTVSVPTPAPVISPGESRPLTITVTAPEDASNDAKISFTISVMSEDNVTTHTHDIDVLISRIDLSVIEDRIVPRSVVTGEGGVFEIPVVNDGFLPASKVIVTVSESSTEFTKSVEIDIPAEGETIAEVAFEAFETGTYYFDVSIDQGSQPAVGEPEDLSFRVSVDPTSDADEPIWLPVIVGILLILVMYGGYKMVKSRSGSRF